LRVHLCGILGELRKKEEESNFLVGNNMDKKERFIAILIVIFIFAGFLMLAWLTKTGGFGVLADVVKNPKMLTK